MVDQHSGASWNNPGGYNAAYPLPPRSISTIEVSEKIHRLETKLAERTFELEGIRQKLNIALIDGAYTIVDIAHLQAALDSARKLQKR